MGIGPGEIILIVIVAIMIFGAAKIPEIGKQVGKGVRDFKKYSSGADGEKAAGPEHKPVIPTAPAETSPLVSNQFPHGPFSKN
jgi:sec-independent protein translocase protein TatA